MILGLEIVLTVMALYMLITGKSVQAKKLAADGVDPKDWRFRLLGGAILTFWPVALIGGIVFGLVWAFNTPGATGEQWEVYAKGDGRLTIGLIEAGIVICYALAAGIIDWRMTKWLRRRAGVA